MANWRSNQKTNIKSTKNQKTNYEHKHKAQMRKGVLRFCILSVLKEKDATHRKY
jgi:hypothetical protein